MKLNDEDVFINDRVFDISTQRGYGHVSRVADKYIEVKFSRYSVRYDIDGVQLGKDWQTLFWDRPLIINPSKTDNDWAKKQNMIKSFYELVRKYRDCV